jgi:hypothetical protein
MLQTKPLYHQKPLVVVWHDRKASCTLVLSAASAAFTVREFPPITERHAAVSADNSEVKRPNIAPTTTLITQGYTLKITIARCAARSDDSATNVFMK